MELPARLVPPLLAVLLASSTAQQTILSFVVFTLGVIVGIVALIAADRYTQRRR